MGSKTFAAIPEFVKSAHYMLGGPGTLDASATWKDENNATITYAKKGTLLGKKSATGLLVPYNNSASDGSQTAVGILWEDVSFGDAGNENNICVYMIHGRVDENKLIGCDSDAKTDLPRIQFEGAPTGAVPLWSVLTGVITGSDTELPLTGAVFTLTLPDGSSVADTTDTDGAYELVELPFGTLSYSIAKTGYDTKTGTVAIGYNEKVTLNVVLTKTT